MPAQKGRPPDPSPSLGLDERGPGSADRAPIPNAGSDERLYPKTVERSVLEKKAQLKILFDRNKPTDLVGKKGSGWENRRNKPTVCTTARDERESKFGARDLVSFAKAKPRSCRMRW
jgi:hypothetical protein